jgi:Domain of unknown function (DUF1877)
MGLELSYQALPADCGLVERARADVAFADSVQLIPSWFAHNRPAPEREGEMHGGATDPAWDWCCRLAAQWPDLYQRNCYLDRWWDKLHFLLSARRRGQAPQPGDDVVDQAFNAGGIIAEHVRAGQGAPIRYLEPAIVTAIASRVSPWRFEDVAVHYDAARMEAAAVYKHHAPCDEAREFIWLAECFTLFQSFFRAASAKGEAVLACKD